MGHRDEIAFIRLLELLSQERAAHQDELEWTQTPLSKEDLKKLAEQLKQEHGASESDDEMSEEAIERLKALSQAIKQKEEAKTQFDLMDTLELMMNNGSISLAFKDKMLAYRQDRLERQRERERRTRSQTQPKSEAQTDRRSARRNKEKDRRDLEVEVISSDQIDYLEVDALWTRRRNMFIALVFIVIGYFSWSVYHEGHLTPEEQLKRERALLLKDTQEKIEAYKKSVQLAERRVLTEIQRLKLEYEDRLKAHEKALHDDQVQLNLLKVKVARLKLNKVSISKILLQEITQKEKALDQLRTSPIKEQTGSDELDQAMRELNRLKAQSDRYVEMYESSLKASGLEPSSE